MKLPLIYQIKNVTLRWGTTLVTSLSIAVVVATFIVIMSIAQGFKDTVVSTGSSDNYIVKTKSADSVRFSYLSREQAQRLMVAPGIAKDQANNSLTQLETVVTIYLRQKNCDQYANITWRGMSGPPAVLRRVKIVKGRDFHAGMNELIVGKALSEQFANLEVGSTLRLSSTDWQIVGHFTTGGTSFDSELWGDANQIMASVKVSRYNCALAKIASAEGLHLLEDYLSKDPVLADLGLVNQKKYYAGQAEVVTMMIGILCGVITVVMAVGAIFNALQCLYTMVTQRRREIGIFLAIGFSKWTIAMSFLIEALLISLLGGIIGCALSLLAHGISAGTVNWQTFSQVAFQFKVTPQLMLRGLILAAVLGLIGGILPAWNAARRQVVRAIQDV